MYMYRMANTIKQEKLWGLTWFKGTGGQSLAIENKKDNEIIVAYHSEKRGRAWACCPINQIEKLISTNRGLYEVLDSYPKKLYFDIDFEDPPEDFCQDSFLKMITLDIQEFYPNAEFSVSGSITSTKASFHLVATNYIIKDEEQLERAKQIAKALWTNHNSLDWKVYTKNRQMKIVGQSKPNKPIQAQISDHKITDFFITCYFNEGCMEIPIVDKLPEIKLQKVDPENVKLKTSSIPNCKLANPNDISWKQLGDEDNKEKLLMIIPHGDHAHTFRVCNYCISNNIDQEAFVRWLSIKEGDASERIAKYKNIHWNFILASIEADPSIKISQERMRSYLPMWYPDIKPQDMELKQFMDLWNLPPNAIVESTRPTLHDLETNQQKFQFLANPMGTGKTECVMEYMNKYSNGHAVWIAPRKTLVDDTVERMQQRGFQCTDYQKISSAKLKTKLLPDPEETPNAVICTNSIHYLGDRTPNVLIIDEIETILNMIGSKQNESFLKTTTKLQILKQFERLVASANKVIILDAFLTMRTIRYITTLGSASISPENIVIYKSPKPASAPRKVCLIESKIETVISNIAKDICDGKRIIAFYPFKKQNNNAFSMEQIVMKVKKMCSALGYQGNMDDEFVYYNADVDEKTKTEIKNVNDYWKQRKLVIFNNTITAGVSYTNSPFDDCYCFIAPFNSPRDIAQVSYRARALSSETIKIKYMAGLQPEAWGDDRQTFKSCTGYNQLYKDTLIEAKSPLKPTVLKFFQEANYHIDDPLVLLYTNEELSVIFKQGVPNWYAYGAIKSINSQQFESIAQTKYKNGDEGWLTTADILSARKYVFDSHFKPNVSENERAIIWDSDNANTIALVHEACNNPDSFETILARDNNWEFFPHIEKESQRWDIKLSDEARKSIFGQFQTLRFESNTMRINMLLKTIYNTKYHKPIISTRKIEGHTYYDAAGGSLLLDLVVEIAKNGLNKEVGGCLIEDEPT
jgi:hypothetical protein